MSGAGPLLAHCSRSPSTHLATRTSHIHPHHPSRTLAAAAVLADDDVRAQRRGRAAADPDGGGARAPGGSPSRAGRVPAAGGHLVPRLHGGAAPQHPGVAPSHGAAGGGEELRPGGGGGGHAVGVAPPRRPRHERVALRALRRDPAGAPAVPRLPEGVEAPAQRLHRRRVRGPPLRPGRLQAARGHAHQGPVLPVPPRMPPDASRLRHRRPPRAAGSHGAGRETSCRGGGGSCCSGAGEVTTHSVRRQGANRPSDIWNPSRIRTQCSSAVMFAPSLDTQMFNYVTSAGRRACDLLDFVLVRESLMNWRGIG